MPSVSDCPYCGQRTGIPENLDPETMVRCPICAYEFALDHALMYAEEAPPEHIAEFPPELIPVSAAAATDAAPPGETEAPAEAAASADAAGAPVESAATESAAVSQEQSEAEGAPKADAAPADDGGAAAGRQAPPNPLPRTALPAKLDAVSAKGSARHVQPGTDDLHRAALRRRTADV